MYRGIALGTSGHAISVAISLNSLCPFRGVVPMSVNGPKDILTRHNKCRPFHGTRNQSVVTVLIAEGPRAPDGRNQ